MNHAIHYSGLLDGKKKYKLLKQSKIFTTTSKFDTGNMALGEALGCQIPGVIFDIPHLHYDCGVIKVPVGDSDLMTKQILKLLNSPHERHKLGLQGRTFIKEYGWEKVSNRVLDIFDKFTGNL